MMIVSPVRTKSPASMSRAYVSRTRVFDGPTSCDVLIACCHPAVYEQHSHDLDEIDMVLDAQATATGSRIGWPYPASIIAVKQWVVSSSPNRGAKFPIRVQTPLSPFP